MAKNLQSIQILRAERAIALGCPADKIVKLPMGLNLSLYQFKARYLEANEPIKIITVARLVEKKGIEYSIRAVAEVLKQYPNLIYRIVGDGVLRNSLEELIRELGVSEKIKLLGWMTQEEVRQLYVDSHLFILSSVTAQDGDKEGQGLVLQEAQAMGLPVLSTIHNGIPDGVLDGKSGFLVPETDVKALVERISYLITNPEKWPEMGRVGRAFVEENYDINLLNDRLVKIYENLLKSSEPSNH
ncbi:glycosyltransferase [Capilliphycus salinus ALCB114379]|uniref:glycosyltransferase n=1 Tax=Capilliphycus salinus TaxID=2768948 RepID=UPI0039A50500